VKIEANIKQRKSYNKLSSFLLPLKFHSSATAPIHTNTYSAWRVNDVVLKQ